MKGINFSSLLRDKASKRFTLWLVINYSNYEFVPITLGQISRKNLFLIKQLRPYHFFILLWLILNLIQAAFTQLTSDEGYYWLYARTLEWGYYDHPPMVALMIKAGALLFRGELGIRLVNVLFSTGAIYLLIKILPYNLRNSPKVYILLLSCPLISYLALIVFPDGPLLFFTMLFLFIYKRFIKVQNWQLAFFLGVSMALMFYSKYHGLLVVFFMVLANLKLLKSPYFYLSVIIALLLFIPHLIWQYQHHFITLGYHLSGRTDQLSLHHVLEYISQQIPAIGPGLLFIPFVYKTKDIFERTLKYIIIGTFIFFLMSSFKTFVHFHWTSISLFPIVLLAAAYYDQGKHHKLFNWIIVPFAILILVLRIQLLFSILPINHANVDYYKGRDLWAEDVAKVAGDYPVVFPNNLREASLYSFYSKKLGLTQYGRPGKKTQYDLWNYEDSVQQKVVVFAALYPYPGGHKLMTRMGQTIFYKIIPSYQSYYNHVPIKVTFVQPLAGDSLIHCFVSIINERSYPLNFAKNSEGQPPVLIYSIEKSEQIIQSDTIRVLTVKDQLKPGESKNINFNISINKVPPGAYQILFGIRFGILPEAFNSDPLNLTIKMKRAKSEH